MARTGRRSNQEFRDEIVGQLRETVVLCREKMLDEQVTLPERQRWAQSLTSAAQVMNTVLRGRAVPRMGEEDEIARETGAARPRGSSRLRALGADPDRWIREMEAEFAEDEDVYLSLSLIQNCIDPNLIPIFQEEILDGSDKTLEDSQGNPRDQRRKDNRHSHRLPRHSADQEAREPDGPRRSVLTCEHNTGESIIKQLSSIPGFVEASTVPGQFDIVALWQAKTSEEIVKNSVERVSNPQGIFKSETLLAHAPFFKA